jgi:predicted pyridoxine 5'-phosphate oxidase superfamily flavin-nucleotide-binding protein
MSQSRGPFHPGEIEIQRRAGVLDDARRVGRIIAGTIPQGARRFLGAQRMVVTASLDAEGHAWASLLTGPAGCLEVVDERMLRIEATPPSGDPLTDNLRARPELALLVLDPRTRQRMRFAGRGLLAPEGIFLLADQVYGNCPKYIQLRRLEAEGLPAPSGLARRTDRLGARTQALVASADTFFIASAHPQGGADASHRGGNPGFVTVVDDRRLRFPNYAGNNMFNTLGNLQACPRAGLLFVDFERGDLLSMTGGTRLDSDLAVELEIDAVVEMPGGSPLRWSLVEYSPANP